MHDRPLEPELRTVSADAAAPAWVDRDVPCAGCGYNVRHLGVDRACPECGASLGPTLDPTRLVFADPRWLRRLRIGLIVLAIGVTVQPLIYAALWGAYQLAIPVHQWVAPWWWTPLWNGPAVVVLAGVWLLTAREQALDTRSTRAWARPAARWATAAYVLIPWVLRWIDDSRLWGLASPGPGPTRALVWVNVYSILYALHVLAIVALFVWLLGLVRRLPDRWLQRRLRWMMTVYVPLVGCLHLLELGRVAFWYTQGHTTSLERALMRWTGYAQTAAYVLGMTLGLALAALALVLASRLRHARRYALAESA